MSAASSTLEQCDRTRKNPKATKPGIPKATKPGIPKLRTPTQTKPSSRPAPKAPNQKNVTTTRRTSLTQKPGATAGVSQRRAATTNNVSSNQKQTTTTRITPKPEPRMGASQKSRKAPDPRPRVHKRTPSSISVPKGAVTDTPLPPPRSAVGIKRSVTSRTSPNGSCPKENLTKHPSLEKQKSISSTSSSDSLSCRKVSTNSRALKTRPVARPPDKVPRRGLKQPSVKSRTPGAVLGKENVAEKFVKCQEPAPPTPPVQSAVPYLEDPTRNRTNSLPMPDVNISPAHLRLNRTLHERLSHPSCRGGIVLSESEASLVSLYSEASRSMSDRSSAKGSVSDAEKQDEVNSQVSIDAVNSQVSIDEVSSQVSIDEVSSQVSIDDVFHDLDNDYDEVVSDTDNDTLTRATGRDNTPDVETTDDAEVPECVTKPGNDDVLNIAMNDLSDPNKSPSQLNITSEDNISEDTSASDLDVDIPSRSTMEESQWYSNTPTVDMFHSPEDNYLTDQGHTSDKDMYYDSSELSLDATEKCSNTQNQNMFLIEKDLNKDIKYTNKTVESKAYDFATCITSPTLVGSGLSTPTLTLERSVEDPPPVLDITFDADPLGVLDYSPIIYLQPNMASSTVSALSFHAHFAPNTGFRRNQRSIRPRKNRRVIVRSASLDKKYLTETTSLAALDIPRVFIVEDLISPISLSANHQYLSSITPEILITNEEPTECTDTLFETPTRRIMGRSKVPHDVVRRFSETQVFKHHREKYIKQKEQQSKYSSCPVTSTSEKLDSPKYIRGFVKRVSSLLNPTVRVLNKKDRHSFGSTFSVDTSIEDEMSRSLHDDMPDSPQNLSISGSLKKSNSLEFDEISSIRRSHTDGDTSDHGVTKAKSISEQLERLKFNSNVQLPPLEFQDWTDFIPASRLEELTKQEKDQQHQIWELITTEHSYLCKVSVVVNTLLSALRQLQNEHFLIKISEKDVFLNIEDIQDIHMSFWRGCLVPLMQEAKDLGEPLNPDKLTEADSLSGVRLFDEELNPLFDYCIKYTECRSYIKVQQKNSDFKEFINWCTTQLRANFDKLGFYDMLIKPIQRIQQYHYILHNIMRNTSDEDVKTNLGHFYDKVKRFGDQLNTRKEEKEEEQKIEGIKERLDGYNVVSTSGNSSDQINQVLSQYNKFDLAERVPLLGKQRKFLHETQCKMTTPTDSKAADLALFLFSDMMLITKPYKGSKKKCRIIKQPLTLDKVVIEELKDAHHTSLVIYLNEYRSAVDMFLLQCANQESHTTLLNAVKHAKDNYQRDKCNYYSELDGSKSVSTTSVNSTNSAFLVSPPNHRHQSCSITRSSSEHYPPTRRIITEPSTSVARAQSMPASNEKRVLLVEQNNNLAASSASSSASTSSASICDTSGSGISIDSSAKSITLSGIKESDKGMEDKLQEDSDEATIKHETKKFEDSFISDNLTREFNGKLDMTKNIGDTVLTTNESEYYSKTDDIYSLNLELDKS